MKTITKEFKVYEFSELSQKAKEKAYSDWYSNNNLQFYFDEMVDSLNEFKKMINIDIKFDLEYNYINFKFKFNENNALSGVRLMKYIYNNFKQYLYKGKFFYYKGKSKYSKGIIEENFYPFTGVCYDTSLINPIFEFLKNPKNTTYTELMQDCLNSWLKDCRRAIDYFSSLDCFIEEIEANEYTFLENGKLFA